MEQLFRDSLPKKPYCSNNKTASRICKADTAVSYAYIQPNPPGMVGWLVFDMDVPDASSKDYEWLIWPVPNIVVVNPSNGHAHYFYRLEVPVCTTDKGHEHPKRFLRHVRDGLTVLMGADQNYVGLMAKTPFHPAHLTMALREESYSIGELAEFIPNAWKKDWHFKSRTVSSLGRNCSLFDALRHWAYQWINKFREVGWSEWHAACLAQANKLNEFPGHPAHSLSASEVKSIAKSVAKWTWETYTSVGGCDAEFKQRQAFRGSCKGEALRRKLLPKAMQLAAEGLGGREIARQLGVNHQTVGNWLKRGKPGLVNHEVAKSHQITAPSGGTGEALLQAEGATLVSDMPGPPTVAYPPKKESRKGPPKKKEKLRGAASPVLSQDDQEAMDKAWGFYEKNCPGCLEHYEAGVQFSQTWFGTVNMNKVFEFMAVGFPPKLLHEGGIAAVKRWVQLIEASERAKRGIRPAGDAQ